MKKYIIGVSLIGLFIAGFLYYGKIQQVLKEDQYSQFLICNNLDQINNQMVYPDLIDKDKTKKFYKKFCENSKVLPWFDEDLNLTTNNSQLIEGIKLSFDHGLDSESYHLEKIQKQIKDFAPHKYLTPQEKAKFANIIDVYSTDAYLALFDDSYHGITDWNKFKKLQYSYAQELAIKKQEEKRLKLLEMNITDQTPEEEKIRKFEWEKPQKALLDENIYLIDNLKNQAIFESLKSLHPKFKEYNRFVEALKNFREQKATNNIHKIILNMERFRWLTKNYEESEKAVVVNIPSFKMQVVEFGDVAWDMRVIVGKPERPTPILEGSLTYATLNPYWTAPETIIKEDIVKKNDVIGYIKSHNMKVFNVKNKTPVNAEDINWSVYKDRKDIPFIFRAEPGIDNPLGELKFTFPNKYSVYMHDTNHREFFKYDYRAFSSGCVRLKEPKKLLGYFLGKNEDINLTKLNTENKPEMGLNLKIEVPIVFKYMTVSIDKQNQISYYEDIYGYDLTNMKSMKGSEKLFEIKSAKGVDNALWKNTKE